MNSSSPGGIGGQNTRPAVITIGTFDGVHLGHHTILEELKKHAAAIDGDSLVVTFEPHPRQVLQPDVPVKILTPLAEKLALLTNAGIDHVAVTPFTKEFAALSAEEYVRSFLVGQFRPAAIVIGYDHHFGHDRRGDISLLRDLSRQFGFSVHEIPARMIDDAAVSSTKIRAALSGGDVKRASDMLGRDYSVSGTVVHGEKLGRTLGYPTANIAPDNVTQLIPAQGVYAVNIVLDEVTYPAMLSIGTRPTVSSTNSVTIEAYLFDFNQDIYDRALSVQFVERMRDEEKYDSLEALIAALEEDERNARNILGI